MLRLSLLALLLPFAVACATRDHGDRPVPDASTGDTGMPDANVDAGTQDSGPRPDLGEPPDTTIVYAHSSHTLYAFDPRTNMVSTIGDFTLLDGTPTESMTDLAVDQHNQIYTCSRTAIYTVNRLTAVATHIADITVPAGAQFNGLTFVPAGVLDPVDEVLVGATDAGDYFSVDRTTGALMLRGTYQSGFGDSGDLVSVAGAGTFATVKRSDLTTDHLARIDPATGATTDLGDIGFAGVFGLGYWRAKLYGFTKTGQLIRIDVTTGAGTLVTTMTGATQFYGAGVTTLAPILI